MIAVKINKNTMQSNLNAKDGSALISFPTGTYLPLVSYFTCCALVDCAAVFDDLLFCSMNELGERLRLTSHW